MSVDDLAHPPDPADVPNPSDLQAAFRELHQVSLHGFALLVHLGDESRAGPGTSRALTEGQAHVDRLRHPQRAAAWLRRWVVRHRPQWASRARVDDDRRRRLGALGVTGPAAVGLAQLRPDERAALVADAIERLDRRDVGTIVGRHGEPLERLIMRARRRYIEAYVRSATGAVTDGPLVRSIHRAAQRVVR